MKKKSFYFHIGMPKTATSYMQKYMFPKIDGIHYLGKYFEAEQNFFNLDFRYDIIFMTFEEFISKYSKEKIQNLFQDYTDKDILISEEGIIGYVFLPNSNLQSEHTVNLSMNIMKLTYLSECLEYKPKFIVTIRSQLELLTSMYAENYNKFYRFYRHTNNFDKFIQYYMKDNNILNFECLDSVVKNIAKTEVSYLFYGQIKKDFENYKSELGKVLELDLTSVEFQNVLVNASSDGKSKKVKKVTVYHFLQRLKYKYFKNTFFKVPDIVKRMLNFKILSDKKVILTEQQKQKIEIFYKDKNKSFLEIIKKAEYEIYL